MYKDILLIPALEYNVKDYSDEEKIELWNKRKKELENILSKYTCRMCGNKIKYKAFDFYDGKIKCEKCNIKVASIDIGVKDYNIENIYTFIINGDMVGEFERLYYRRHNTGYSYGVVETEQYGPQEAFDKLEECDKVFWEKRGETETFKFIY